MRRILFIFTSQTSEDRGAWSGTMYQSFQGLVRAGYQVDYLCATRDNKRNRFNNLLWRYWSTVPRLLGKQMRCDEAFYSVCVFRGTLKLFDYSPYEIVFIPTHLAIVNALPKNLKAMIIHLVDATVDSLFNYYTEFSNLTRHNYLEAHILGKRAFHRSDLIIASSDWCKNNAIKDYGISHEKIAVIEFGANIDTYDIPATPKQIDSKQQLNIYWSGVNWERKGGDIALVCCQELIKRGYNITLHITGIRASNLLTSQLKAYNFVQNHGFLNKNKPEEYKHLIEIMNKMDIFLFPSKAECSSIALCEANGFGLPCFVYDTGGTGNYVVNAENGYLLPLTANGLDFANRIEASIKGGELNKLSQGAVNKYNEKLNWVKWSERVKSVIDKL